MKSLAILALLGLVLSLPAHAQLNGPQGVLFDSKGNLWVANGQGNNVLELDPSTGAILNTISNGVNGSTRLCIDSLGHLWVDDTGNNTITVYDKLEAPGAHLIKSITNPGFSRSLGMVVDAYGDLYVSNTGTGTNDILAFNIAGGLVETLTKDAKGFPFDAPGVMVIQGQRIYVGFGPNYGTNFVISYNVGEFLTGDVKEITYYNDNVNTGPTGIAFDQKGNIYIAEFTSNSWVEYRPSGELPPLLVVDDGQGAPSGIAVDRQGYIYVSNANYNNITVYNQSGQLINTLN